MRILVGIDPGASGGIAYCLGETMVTARAMPETEGDIIHLLRAVMAEANGEVLRVVMEEVGGYIGEAQPASSAFKFGRCYGFLLGVLQTLGARVELIRPQSWQKALGLGASGRTRASYHASAEEREIVRKHNAAAKAEWKRKLKQKAEQLFPGVNVTLKTCDALLLLEYARQAYPNG